MPDNNPLTTTEVSRQYPTETYKLGEFKITCLSEERLMALFFNSEGNPYKYFYIDENGSHFASDEPQEKTKNLGLHKLFENDSQAELVKELIQGSDDPEKLHEFFDAMAHITGIPHTPLELLLFADITNPETAYTVYPAYWARLWASKGNHNENPVSREVYTTPPKLSPNKAFNSLFTSILIRAFFATSDQDLKLEIMNLLNLMERTEVEFPREKWDSSTDSIWSYALHNLLFAAYHLAHAFYFTNADYKIKVERANQFLSNQNLFPNPSETRLQFYNNRYTLIQILLTPYEKKRLHAKALDSMLARDALRIAATTPKEKYSQLLNLATNPEDAPKNLLAKIHQAWQNTMQQEITDQTIIDLIKLPNKKHRQLGTLIEEVQKKTAERITHQIKESDDIVNCRDNPRNFMNDQFCIPNQVIQASTDNGETTSFLLSALDQVDINTALSIETNRAQGIRHLNSTLSEPFIAQENFFTSDPYNSGAMPISIYMHSIALIYLLLSKISPKKSLLSFATFFLIPYLLTPTLIESDQKIALQDDFVNNIHNSPLHEINQIPYNEPPFLKALGSITNRGPSIFISMLAISALLFLLHYITAERASKPKRAKKTTPRNAGVYSYFFARDDEDDFFLDKQQESNTEGHNHATSP